MAKKSLPPLRKGEGRGKNETYRTHRGYYFKDAKGRWRTPNGASFATAKKAQSANARRRGELIRRDARAFYNDSRKRLGLKTVTKKTFDKRFRGRDRVKLADRLKASLRKETRKAATRRSVERRALSLGPSGFAGYVSSGGGEEGDVDVGDYYTGGGEDFDADDYMDDIFDDIDFSFEGDVDGWGDTP